LASSHCSGALVGLGMLKARPVATFCLLALVIAFASQGGAIPEQAEKPARQERVTRSGYKCSANLNNGGKSRSGSSSQADADKQYVGSGTCRGCHGEIPESFDQGPHGKTMTDVCALPRWQNCETCHGPGRQHADTGGDQDTIVFPPALSPKDLNQRCLSCHEFPKGHDKWMDPGASPQKTGCLECHSVHSRLNREP